MYSPSQQQEYNLDTDQFNQQQQQQQQQTMETTTVGAVPVARNSRLFNPNYQQQLHQRQNSFGTVASAITMSPPNHRTGGMAYADTNNNNNNNNNSQNWFGTSLDSNGSSFGQSPIFAGRDLIVSPSTSTGHIDNFTSSNTNNEEDEAQQRK